MINGKTGKFGHSSLVAGHVLCDQWGIGQRLGVSLAPLWGIIHWLNHTAIKVLINVKSAILHMTNQETVSFLG